MCVIGNQLQDDRSPRGNLCSYTVYLICQPRVFNGLPIGLPPPSSRCSFPKHMSRLKPGVNSTSGQSLSVLEQAPYLQP